MQNTKQGGVKLPPLGEVSKGIDDSSDQKKPINPMA